MIKNLRIIIATIFVLNIFGMSACESSKMEEYYLEKENYVNATGTVVHIKYSENKDVLYLGFSNMIPEFDDTVFKIVGENTSIVQERGIDEKIETGSNVEFITAPKYWGDGYVMPIVALTVNGEELLCFDEGYDNFMDWFNENN